MQGWEDERLAGSAAEPTGALHAGNLAPEVDDATLAEAFSACGALSAVVWREPSTGQSLGHGSVRFATPAEARFAIDTLSGRMLCGRPLELRFAAADRPSAGQAAHGGPYPSVPTAGADAAGGDIGPSPNLYIKGLPPGTTDVGLRNVFSPFGTIVDSRVLYPQSAAPSALLRYTAVHEAAAAIAAMHNVTPPGATNALQVRYAESQADKARRATRPAPGDVPGPRGPPPLPAGAEAVERVECPHSLVGWLIGRGGETIRGLQTRSGSGISIDQNLPEGVPRIVVITGNREQVALGKQLVEELLVSGAARGGGTWPGGGGGGGAMPVGGGAGGAGGALQWGGRNDHGPGQQLQQMQAPQAAVHGTGPAMQPGYAAPGNRPMAEAAAEEPEPEPPTFDAEYVAAAKAAAAESAPDLPSELRLVDAPLQHLAILAAQRAGSSVPAPSKLGSRAQAIFTSALRELCAASQRGVVPSQALLSTLMEASTLLAAERDWTFGVMHADADVALDETEEANIARAVVACASHLAAPALFARYAGDAERNAALGAAGVSAAGLLCADERRSVRFFSAGGAVVLASVASQSGTPAFICVAAVQALARATRFASACVFMLDEWRCNDAEPHETPSATVARLLLSPQRAKLAQHAVTVLQHCHVCCLAWHVRAAADDGVSCKVALETLTLLLHQQRNSNAVPGLLLDDSKGAASHFTSLPSEASTLSLLADARILPSLALAVRQAGKDAQAGAQSLVRELASSLLGLYVLSSEAAAAVDLAGSAGDVASLIRAVLLGVTALEALLHGDSDVGLLGALHSLSRLSRDAASRGCAALLLSAPGVLDRLLDVLAAPPVPTAPDDPFSLTHGLAMELLLVLLSDGRVEALGSWVPHVRRISKVVDKVEPATSSATWSLVRDWLAAGSRLHERGIVGLLTWLSALVLNGESGAPSAADAVPAPSGTTIDAQPAGGVASFAPLSAGSRVGVLCTLRLLTAAARSAQDEAVTLFGMDALGVIAVLLRRTGDVLACCGASSAEDPAALEEDLEAGPAVGACRRFIRAADICAAAAQLAHPLLQQLREGGVPEYRSSALVGALSAAHAASAVQHAAGGPLCAAAYAVRVECASALAFWATGAPAWQPRALHVDLGEADMTPRAAMACALLIVDLLPPVGRPGRLSEETLAQLLSDVQPAALAALLRAAAASTSARLNAAAVQALARVASLSDKHAACVAEACVEASANLPEGDSVPGQLSHALQMLTGAADATDAAEVASALRARLRTAGLDSLPVTADSLPVSYGSSQFLASLEAVFLSADHKPVSWRIPREGLRFADDAAKRKRIVRAEARLKRSKACAGTASRHAEAAQPLPLRRKPASGAGRTMHVDEFQARQAALKGIPAAEAAPPVPAPPPEAAAALPATAPAAAAAPKMLSIKFGAPSSAPAAATPAAAAAPVLTTSVAEAQPPSVLDQWEPEGAFQFSGGQPYAEEPAPQPPAAAPPPFEHVPPPPSACAPTSVIPGLGGFSAAPAAAPVIPGLGFTAAPPPALVAPRAPVAPPQPPPRPPPQHVAVPLPQPPAGLPPVRPPQPPAGPPPLLQQSWPQQAPPQPQQGWPQHAQPVQPAWELQQPAVQPSALLMQQLSSPEAIQQLLNDPARLAALLTQFPALASMLQERLHGVGQR